MRTRLALVVGLGSLLGVAGALGWWALAGDDGGDPAPALTAGSARPSTSLVPTTTTTPNTTTSRPAPVSPAYTFPIRPAGSASYGRTHHDYPATDVFAPCGTDYLAPVGGTVHEVNGVDRWDPANDSGATRGGRYVSVVGDDGVRYYASHLASVESGLRPGTRVEAGDLLGTVGESGNARGTGCHVHFGVSPPCEPGEWSVRRGVVYPWPYLNSWRGGGAQSPGGEVEAWSAAHPDACATAQRT